MPSTKRFCTYFNLCTISLINGKTTGIITYFNINRIGGEDYLAPEFLLYSQTPTNNKFEQDIFLPWITSTWFLRDICVCLQCIELITKI